MEKVDEPVLHLQIDELMVHTTQKQGPYNSETYLAHVVARPKEAMLLHVPVSELNTLKTVEEAIAKMTEAAVAGVRKAMPALGVTELPTVSVGVNACELPDEQF